MTRAAILSEEQKMEYWQATYPWSVGLFYYFQGFYFLGTRIYVLAQMANWGVLTDTQATVLAILGLPSYLKVLPALLSDRVPVGRWGRRKPYILLGGLVFIPSYLLLIRIQEFDVMWVACILLLMIAWMVSDASLDALVVDITPQARTAQIQGVAESSRQAGGILGTLLVPLLGPRLGWTPVLVILGAGALLSSAAALPLREVHISRAILEKELPLKWVLQEAFSHKLIWLGLGFILFFSSIRATGNLTSIYLLSELGWGSSPEMMRAFGLVEVVFTLAAALGAILCGRLPAKLMTSFKLYAVYVLGLWLLTLPWLLVWRAPDNLALVYSARIALGITSGVGFVLTSAMAMRVCPRSIEGFTFALMSATIHFGSLVVGAKTATAFVEGLGGIIPALFTLIPYSLISLIFLHLLLGELKRAQEQT